MDQFDETMAPDCLDWTNIDSQENEFPDYAMDYDLDDNLYDVELNNLQEIYTGGSQPQPLMGSRYPDLDVFLNAGEDARTPGNHYKQHEQIANCATDVQQIVAGNEGDIDCQTMLRRLLDLPAMNGVDLQRAEVTRYVQEFAIALQRHLKIPENNSSGDSVILTDTKMLAQAEITIQYWPALVKVILQSGVLVDINGRKTVQKILGLVTVVEENVRGLSRPPKSKQSERQPIVCSTSRKCPECQRTFSNQSLLNRHRKTHEGGDKICKNCRARYGNQTSLTKHEKMCEGGNGVVES